MDYSASRSQGVDLGWLRLAIVNVRGLRANKSFLSIMLKAEQILIVGGEKERLNSVYLETGVYEWIIAFNQG